MLSYEFIFTIINLGISVMLVYLLLKTTKESKKFYLESQHELEEQKLYTKSLDQKIEDILLLDKINKTCFIGIGGGGSNIIQNIANFDNRHKFIHINSDRQALNTKTSSYKILLDFKHNKGLGCGGDIECGKKSVTLEAKQELSSFIEKEKTLHVVVTLGGGIGSGATPAIIEYLKSINKEIILFIIMPFVFEGKKKENIAKSSLDELKSITKDIIVLQNNDLMKKDENKSLGFSETLKIISDEVYAKIAHQSYTAL